MAARPAFGAVDAKATAATQPTAIALGGDARGLKQTQEKTYGEVSVAGGSHATGTGLLQQQQQRPIQQLGEQEGAAQVFFPRNMNHHQGRELARSPSQTGRNR